MATYRDIIDSDADIHAQVRRMEHGREREILDGMGIKGREIYERNGGSGKLEKMLKETQCLEHFKEGKNEEVDVRSKNFRIKH